MTLRIFEASFGEHIPQERIDSLITGPAACGDVRMDENGNYLIEVRRARKLALAQKHAQPLGC